MAFDRDTRNKLSSFVHQCRRLLCGEYDRPGGEIARLLAHYGIQVTGEVTEVDQLPHLDESGRDTARLLREILEFKRANTPQTRIWRQYDPAVYDLLQEQAFTVLNRLCALRMAEARGILQPCVSEKTQSAGFQLYEYQSGKSDDQGTRYRHFLFSVFDEIALDLPALFDRFSPQGLLFPSHSCIEALLDEINAEPLEKLWAEDETIGWIYQYWNSKEERTAMRDASAAPRNSRELAVRNQFFTPRYVVEFLVENTLGRTWYEMLQGETALNDRCNYLARLPRERFQREDEPLKQPAADENDSSKIIPFRKLKDPREIRLLDPACGSMHFGLYAFDLFEQIYEEAWDRDLFPDLKDSYADKDAFLADVPKLIIENNIHGADIDPRAVQIAGLSLWLRAQKSWQGLGLEASNRPNILRSNIVCAEPMPGEREELRRFCETLDQPALAGLVERIFVKMRDANVAGSLLPIEKEISSLVATAKQDWLEGPKLKQAELFEQPAAPKTDQSELGLDFSGITDEAFWDKAEERIYRALDEYSNCADGNFSRKLFSEDANRGFAFIDLCRRRYDVVVMNPPFGKYTKDWAKEAKAFYPNSANDILGGFVERGLDLLVDRGFNGAITSRTCFFLASFSDWREKVVLRQSGIRAIADLGQGVMDDAMVEAAAYVLENAAPSKEFVVFRAIADADRQGTLETALSAFREGRKEQSLFYAKQDTFALLPNAPFTYWVDDAAIRQFATGNYFEPDVGNVRQGLATGDDPRFVRANWEVPYEHSLFCYFPSNGDNFCSLDDPIVKAFLKRRNCGRQKWAFHVKAGASQPWYAPITLKIDWENDGHELRNFTDEKGKLRSRPQNTRFYHRPGFSWTRRAVRFIPYVIPGNCIPSVSRYMAFPEHEKPADALAVCASRLVSASLRFYAEFWQRPNFLVDSVKALPWPKLTKDAKAHFDELVTREVEKRRLAYQNHEPFHDFLLPAKIHDFSDAGKALSFNIESLLDAEGEKLVADAYGFSDEQVRSIEKDLLEAIYYRKSAGANANADDADESDDSESDEASKDDGDADFVLDYSPAATEDAHLNYLLGTALGRWDIRYATGERQPPELPDPFDPLPVCPPGMLQGEDGLPLSKDELRRMNDEGTYPLRVTVDGILVDDANDPEDIVSRVREALRVIWGDRATAIEAEAIEILQSGGRTPKDLRDYFRTPGQFFASHLARYSKSRRKAPIYWPLSTASGDYTLWLYYHRLDDQTLLRCVNRIKTKLESVASDRARLDNEPTRSSAQDTELKKLATFEEELRALQRSLEAISKYWKPNLNDGVQITAAPLWEHFRHKPWQKVLKDTWKKLEHGDYDWAHLAHSIWPERVVPKCAQDRSLAIAHGHESRLWHQVEVEAKGKKKQKKLEWHPVPNAEEVVAEILQELKTR